MEGVGQAPPLDPPLMWTNFTFDRKSLHNSFAVIYRNDFSNHPCLNRQYASIVDNTYYHGQTQGLCSSVSSCMCNLPINHFLGYHAILSPWNGEKCVAWHPENPEVKANALLVIFSPKWMYRLVRAHTMKTPYGLDLSFTTWRVVLKSDFNR